MQPPPGKRPRVLCVDDNVASVQARAGVLKWYGYETETLTDETFAVELLERRSGEFAAIVLDYLMPEIRGDRLAAILRERHPQLPIILVSGAVDQPKDLGGADLFVSKSGGFRRLVDALSVLLQKPATRAA